MISGLYGVSSIQMKPNKFKNEYASKLARTRYSRARFKGVMCTDMNSVVKQAIADVLNEMVESQDIMITTTTENVVLEKLFNAVQSVSPNMLTPQELGGIINALNAPDLGFKLDENDFQTIIGLTKEELKNASQKLKLKQW